MNIYDAAGSRAIDAQARDQLRLTGIELMSRAAEAALDVVMQRYPEVRALSVWCGKGNNAGDAWLLAARAARLGFTVQLVGVEPREVVVGDAHLALEQAEAAGLVLQPYHSELVIEGDLLIDGLLGTGFDGNLRPAFTAAIERINAATQPVFALDIPSGVNASSGGVAEFAVQAETTTTFITHKVGLHTGAGPSYAGEIILCRLGVPEVPASTPVSTPEPAPQAYGLWAQPSSLSTPVRQSYKHARGHVLVIGGARGMAGAIALAGEAALRAGAGLVSVVTAAEHAATLLARRPELMVLDADTPAWHAQLASADVVVLGPGLGREAWGRDLYLAVEASGKPTVLDADGLFHLAQLDAWQGGALFITPHVGEAAQLLNMAGTEVELDRLASMRALSEGLHAAVALKGAGTVVGGWHDRRCFICQHGNPGMATAGMGDVLAGLAGGLLGSYCREAATPGVLDAVFFQAVALHSAAADLAVEQVGERSLIASDVIQAMPRIFTGRPHS